MHAFTHGTLMTDGSSPVNFSKAPGDLTLGDVFHMKQQLGNGCHLNMFGRTDAISLDTWIPESCES